jgi:hypothetical protein
MKKKVKNFLLHYALWEVSLGSIIQAAKKIMLGWKSLIFTEFFRPMKIFFGHFFFFVDQSY